MYLINEYYKKQLFDLLELWFTRDAPRWKIVFQYSVLLNIRIFICFNFEYEHEILVKFFKLQLVFITN